MHQFHTVLQALGDRVSTPVPVVLINVVGDNIRRMQAFADRHGKALRPHVKTHKSVEIGRMQLDAGASGLTAGNLGEAEIFAEAGCSDIFVAYPLWASGTKAARLRRLAQRTRLSVGADSAAAIDVLAEAMGELTGMLGVVIEVDCGAARSGTRPALAGELASHARARGLLPLGVEARVVSAGSTPTAAFSIDPIITEIRPGEYVFYDGDNVLIGDCDPADIGLFVASTVVSDQGHPHVIVDAGTKALGREGDPQRGYGQVPDYGGRLTALNEYHGFLQLPEAEERPAVGERVAIVPNHVCPVVNSAEELVIANRAGELLGSWSVDARGRLN